jgi:predicted membrane protein
METNQNSFFAPRIVLGLGIILIGILFLLGNMNIIDSHDYVRYWPVIIIIVGIAYLIQCQRGPGRIWGVILTFIGAAMLLDRLYFIRFSLWDYWPLILVVAGIMMIVRASSYRHRMVLSHAETDDANSFIKAVAIMGGFKRMNNSQDFKGGELTAIMGGFELDLRDASIKEEAIIDIFTMMGGMSMRIPEDWLVIFDVTPFMGGYDDKTRPPKESTKRLVIRGTTIMGGIEIKN